MSKMLVFYEHGGGQWGWAGAIEEVLGEMVVLERVEEVKGEAEDGIVCPDGVRRPPRRRWALHGEGGGILGYLVEV